MFPAAANWLTDDILVGGKPRHSDDFHKITNLGISVFVNLISKQELNHASNYKYHKEYNNIEFYHYPIKDMTTLDDDSMLSIVDHIITLSKDKKIYIHCKGGHGRTGIVAGLILHKLYPNKNYFDILAQLKDGHSTRTYNAHKEMPGSAPQLCQLYRITEKKDDLFFYSENDPYYVLSNYFTYTTGKKKGQSMFKDDNGTKWISSEAYYQAHKYDYADKNAQEYKMLIQQCDTSHKAFLLGRKGGNIRPQWTINKKTNTNKIVAVIKTYKNIAIRDDWDAVKDDIMYKALVYKFTQNQDLKQLLLSTNNRTIHEYSKSDNYWAMYHQDGDFVGESKLGQLLMKLRSELRKM